MLLVALVDGKNVATAQEKVLAPSYDVYAVGDGRSAGSIDNLRPDEGLEPGRDLDRFLCCTTTGCGHDEAEYHDESLSQQFLHSPKFCRDPTAT